MIRDDEDDDNDDEGYKVYNEEEDIPARVVVNVRVTKLPWWWKYGTQMGDFLIISYLESQLQKNAGNKIKQSFPKDLHLAEFSIVA